MQSKSRLTPEAKSFTVSKTVLKPCQTALKRSERARLDGWFRSRRRTRPTVGRHELRQWRVAAHRGQRQRRRRAAAAVRLEPAARSKQAKTHLWTEKGAMRAHSTPPLDFSWHAALRCFMSHLASEQLLRLPRDRVPLLRARQPLRRHLWRERHQRERGRACTGVSKVRWPPGGACARRPA
jgi:hypothetical protein